MFGPPLSYVKDALYAPDSLPVSVTGCPSIHNKRSWLCFGISAVSRVCVAAPPVRYSALNAAVPVSLPTITRPLTSGSAVPPKNAMAASCVPGVSVPPDSIHLSLGSVSLHHTIPNPTGSISIGFSDSFASVMAASRILAVVTAPSASSFCVSVPLAIFMLSMLRSGICPI